MGYVSLPEGTLWFPSILPPKHWFAGKRRTASTFIFIFKGDLLPKLFFEGVSAIRIGTATDMYTSWWFEANIGQNSIFFPKSEGENTKCLKAPPRV